MRDGVVAIPLLLLLLVRWLHTATHRHLAHHASDHVLLVVAVAILVLIGLVPISLGCIVHLNSSTKDLLTLHLLKGAFRLIF